MARKFFALEDAEVVESTDAGLDGAEVLELGDGIQESEVEAAEVDEVATAIEDAEVAADNLEESAAILEQGVESGEGVSEETAQAVEVAVEAALNMLGASHRKNSLMPSLESWGSGSSRLSSTKYALEAVMDKIKEIWKKIVDFVKMIAQKVTDFFVSFFDNTERLKKAAAKMRTKVKEFGSSAEIKDKEIKNGSVTKMFNNGEGKSSFATATSIIGVHSALAQGGGAFVQACSSFVDGTKSIKSQADFEKAADAVVGAAMGGAKGAAKQIDENGRRGYQSPSIIGGRSLELTFGLSKIENHGPATKRGKTAGDQGEEINFGDFQFKTNEPEKKSTKEAETLTYDQALKMIELVENLATATEEYKKAKDKIANLVKATSNAAAAAVNMGDNAGSTAGMRKAITSLSSQVSRMVTMLPSWNVALGKSGLSYVASSMSAWKKPEDKKK